MAIRATRVGNLGFKIIQGRLLIEDLWYSIPNFKKEEKVLKYNKSLSLKRKSYNC